MHSYLTSQNLTVLSKCPLATCELNMDNYVVAGQECEKAQSLIDRNLVIMTTANESKLIRLLFKI